MTRKRRTETIQVGGKIKGGLGLNGECLHETGVTKRGIPRDDEWYAVRTIGKEE